MAVLDVYPTFWLRCRPHRHVFAAMDPVWSRGGHEGCGLDEYDRWYPVVLINHHGYDPRDRNTQRVLMCSECSGVGQVMAMAMMLTELEGPGEIPCQFTLLTCERCEGWGYR